MKKKTLLAIMIFAIILSMGLTFCGCSAQNAPTNDFISNTAENGQIFIYQEIIAKTKTAAVCIYASNNFTSASASGFIISTDGYVVTNQHAVKDYKFYKVVTIDDNGKTREYSASLIASSSSPDIAVLKIQSYDTFSPIKFGKSKDLAFGDPCVMIGNPKGIGFMTARAMVSNPSITLSSGEYVAIDAPVNPGNSGGALINANCEVAGVITSRYSSTGDVNDVVMNVGFAQKTETVMKFLLKQPELATALSYWR